MVDWYIWIAFLAALFIFLGVDLARHQDERVMPFREALAWTALWVGLGLSFGVLVWVWLGGRFAGEYFAGYLIEWSLSVDNVFVWILIFTHFTVPREHQHRVLFWGVVGAIAMRLSFILAGSALLDRFHWVIYVFGGILIVTAIRFVTQREDHRRSLEESLVLRATRRFVPMSESFVGQRFFTRRGTKRVATPLLAVLILIEATDLVFAVDSIPAVFAITRHAFIAFTSNAMAILGLRSLYFVLAGGMARFRYLKPALAVILGFVGVKMLLSSVVHMPIWLSLSVIVGVLGTAAIASWLVSA
ncbi:MAG: TerC family protein, partial [Actinomycetota bacterium]